MCSYFCKYVAFLLNKKVDYKKKKVLLPSRGKGWSYQIVAFCMGLLKKNVF